MSLRLSVLIGLLLLSIAACSQDGGEDSAAETTPIPTRTPTPDPEEEIAEESCAYSEELAELAAEGTTLELVEEDDPNDEDGDRQLRGYVADVQTVMTIMERMSPPDAVDSEHSRMIGRLQAVYDVASEGEADVDEMDFTDENRLIEIQAVWFRVIRVEEEFSQALKEVMSILESKYGCQSFDDAFEGNPV